MDQNMQWKTPKATRFQWWTPNDKMIATLQKMQKSDLQIRYQYDYVSKQ